MTIPQFQTALANMNVTPPDDPLRACLYLQHIQDSYLFFNTTLSGPLPLGLGPGYAFVQTALQDPELLNTLCKALDEFVCQAINAHITVHGAGINDFQTYYTQFFLNANYALNITNFYATYVTTNTLLTQISQNFRTNIRQACERILADRAAITNAFTDNGDTLQRLLKIKSSGSDFHKGGKQVLLLTFSVNSYIPAQDEVTHVRSMLQLVYKPGDLEADCLIAGDSATVNALHPGFQANSLFEILNAGIATALHNNPALSLELLPTYKILPMDYSSNQAINYPPNIVRRAYGYIEFLEHEHYAGPSILNFYPLGNSDYQIFPRQNEGNICRKFYRLIGQISAIAATFSIIDLHAENIIVKNYLPYVIDMEISFTTLIDNITQTILYGGMKPGVTGQHKEDQIDYEESLHGNPVLIDQVLTHKDAQNRLVSMANASVINPVTYAAPLCKGLRDMINVISTVLNAHNLQAWIDRVQGTANPNCGILVRSLPRATGDFRAILTSVSNEINCMNNLVNMLTEFTEVELGSVFTPWQAHPNLDPKFLALQPNYLLADYQNADIPIFYTRLGTLDIVDSNGTVVASPGNVNYRNNPQGPVINAVYALAPPRATYFPALPFTTRVVNTQLNAISADPAKTLRMQTLVGQVLGNLHLANTPGDITNILA